MDTPSLPVQQENQDGSTSGSDENRIMAPDFTVYDINGNAVKLSDFRGKPVVLNFWSSKCGPCVSEMPGFDKAFSSMGHEVNFVMVNMTDGSWDTVESASVFIENSGYSFPVYYDTELQAAMTYGVYSIPTTYFIDAEGYAVTYWRGAMDMDTLMAGIDMIS